jgi:hypothetical protein
MQPLQLFVVESQTTKRILRKTFQGSDDAGACSKVGDIVLWFVARRAFGAWRADDSGG